VSCGGEKKSKRQQVIVNEENETRRNYAPIPNTFLAADEYAVTQVNLAQTNAFSAPIDTGTFSVELTRENQVLSGVVNVATLAADNANYMWAISTDRFTYLNVNEGNFMPTRSFYKYPDNEAFAVEKHKEALQHDFSSIDAVKKSVVAVYGTSPEKRLHFGTVAVCDKSNQCFINNGTQVSCLDQGGGFRRTLNLIGTVPNPTNIVGLGITYDGMLVFAAHTYVGVVDRNFETEPIIFHLGSGEVCTNSLCIDEHNGIYIVSNKLVRKLVWTGETLSDNTADGAWTSPYKTGSKGAASSPSLLGFDASQDKLVLIVDGENNLVALWRGDLPAQKTSRIAQEIPLSFAAANQKPVTAAGLAVHNNGVFVANNSLYTNSGDAIVDAIAVVLGNSAQGCERFEWNTAAKQFVSVFANSSIRTATMKPAVSTTSNIVCVNGFYPETGWEITGLDWNSGNIVHRTLLGKNNFGNAAFATLQFFHNGDMLFNSIAGPARLQLQNH
jgi:hypothetical protein